MWFSVVTSLFSTQKLGILFPLTFLVGEVEEIPLGEDAPALVPLGAEKAGLWKTGKNGGKMGKARGKKGKAGKMLHFIPLGCLSHGFHAAREGVWG